MTAITVLYVMIGLAIRRSTLSRTGSDSSTHSATTGSELRAQQQARARKAVLKMLGWEYISLCYYELKKKDDQCNVSCLL